MFWKMIESLVKQVQPLDNQTSLTINWIPFRINSLSRTIYQLNQPQII